MANNLDAIVKEAARKGFTPEEIEQVSYYWADRYHEYTLKHKHEIFALNKEEYLDVARDYACATTRAFIAKTVDKWHLKNNEVDYD